MPKPRPCRGPEEYPALLEIWRSAVAATHGFLAPADRDEIESRLASDYFPQVTLTVIDVDGTPVGFAGIAGEGLEMLFVDDGHRGTGLGSILLDAAIEDGVRRVDVNEENADAAAFYRRRGFVVAGRSEVDEAGRPYPLLHLRLDRD